MLKNVFSDLRAQQTRAVALREWGQYLDSAVGIVFLMIFLITAGHLTFEPGYGSFFLRGQADLRPFFDYLPWLFAFFIPAMTMRLWAEERKSGSIEFLLTLPMTTRQAVLGKFLAAWKFLGLALLLTFPLVGTVFYLGNPDWAAILTGYMGSWLLAGNMLAIALFASALSKNQVTSFIVGSLLLTLFLLMDAPSVVDVLDNVLPAYPLALVENLGLIRHYQPWVKGAVRLSGVLFSVVSIGFWLLLTGALLEKVKAK